MSFLFASHFSGYAIVWGGELNPRDSFHTESFIRLKILDAFLLSVLLKESTVVMQFLKSLLLIQGLK